MHSLIFIIIKSNHESFMKNILYLSLVTCSAFSMQLDLIKCEKKAIPSQKKLALNAKDLNLTNAKTIVFKGNSVFVPEKLGKLNLYLDDNGFSIYQNSQSFPIQRCFMDKELRGISKENLINLMLAGTYLSVNSNDKNEYSLKLHGRLNGGGVGGATFGFYLGRIGTLVIGHGAIIIVGLCTGPAAPFTIKALEMSLSGPIEVASQAAGLAGGMIGAVATGPV